MQVGSSVYVENIPIGMCVVYIVWIDQDKEIITSIFGYEIQYGKNETDFVVY